MIAKLALYAGVAMEAEGAKTVRVESDGVLLLLYCSTRLAPGWMVTLGRTQIFAAAFDCRMMIESPSRLAG